MAVFVGMEDCMAMENAVIRVESATSIPQGLKPASFLRPFSARLNSLRKKARKAQKGIEIGDRKPSPDAHVSILGHPVTIDFWRFSQNSFFSASCKVVPCYKAGFQTAIH